MDCVSGCHECQTENCSGQTVRCREFCASRFNVSKSGMSILPASRHDDFEVLPPTPRQSISPTPAKADADEHHPANPASVGFPNRVHTPGNWLDRIEAFISSLSV